MLCTLISFPFIFSCLLPLDTSLPVFFLPFFFLSLVFLPLSRCLPRSPLLPGLVHDAPLSLLPIPDDSCSSPFLLLGQIPNHDFTSDPHQEEGKETRPGVGNRQVHQEEVGTSPEVGEVHLAHRRWDRETLGEGTAAARCRSGCWRRGEAGTEEGTPGRLLLRGTLAEAGKGVHQRLPGVVGRLVLREEERGKRREEGTHRAEEGGRRREDR